MPTGQRIDPYGGFHFLVEIDGITRAGFQEASGLDSTIDVMEYREGGENTTTRKLRGMVKFSNIVLKNGLTDDVELYQWHRQWASGDKSANRRNGSVIVLDAQGSEKVRWNFVNAWPSKWVGPTFNALTSDTAVETLELSHEGVERA